MEIFSDLGDRRQIVPGTGVFNPYKDQGIEALADHSRRPVHCANQLPEPVERLSGEQ